MAGVLGQLFRPQKTAVQDRRAMELEAAREILAEVFGVKLSEVDEMIENRLEKVPSLEACCGLWPRELWIEGEAVYPADLDVAARARLSLSPLGHVISGDTISGFRIPFCVLINLDRGLCSVKASCC
jgi:hypothetical protein